MRIAVDTRFWHPGKLKGHENFITDVLLTLSKQRVNDKFIFFLDEPLTPAFDIPQNVTAIVITPKPTNWLFHLWWYEVKLPAALRKHKADVFIGTYGVCSLTTKVRQLLITHQGGLLASTNFSFKPASFFLKRLLSQFFKKAQVIAAPTHTIKEEIITNYKFAHAKTIVIGTAVSPVFTAIEWQEREEIKHIHAAGCEYFVFTGQLTNEKNLVDLLKAFSIFKKWQRTNMKLVITENIGNFKGIEEKIATYKYKNEIKLAVGLSKLQYARIVASAYASMCFTDETGFNYSILESIKCEVPVITLKNITNVEIAGDAALYAASAHPEDVAEQMKLVFKDEALRSKLIELGKQQAMAFSSEQACDRLWKAIEKAVSK